MRNAILQVPEPRTAKERLVVLRAAIRQLERAGICLAAVAYMEPDDREAKRAVRHLRTDLDSLLRHLRESRDNMYTSKVRPAPEAVPVTA
ncbi:MAG TPA: hypothetical protein VGU71_03795 [Candidatus Dormibacteraeota bacterium]|nr:hypothetical protein [Candidatus Dormibacteraeota bacterium]